MENHKPVTVTLGDLHDRVENRVRSGAYASLDDVLRAGVRALDREEAADEADLRRKVREALDDRRKPLPAGEVFADLRAHHSRRLKAEGHDA